MRMELIEMVHVQPPNPSVTDSYTGDEFFNDNIRQRRLRSTNMRFNGSETESGKEYL